jgi:hypothetical protein
MATIAAAPHRGMICNGRDDVTSFTSADGSMFQPLTYLGSRVNCFSPGYCGILLACLAVGECVGANGAVDLKGNGHPELSLVSSVLDGCPAELWLPAQCLRQVVVRAHLRGLGGSRPKPFMGGAVTDWLHTVSVISYVCIHCSYSTPRNLHILLMFCMYTHPRWRLGTLQRRIPRPCTRIKIQGCFHENQKTSEHTGSELTGAAQMCHHRLPPARQL